MKKSMVSIRAVLALGLAAPVSAAKVTVDCVATPAPHDALFTAALAAAGPGGTIEVKGDCTVTGGVQINQPNVTLRGRCGSITRVNVAAAGQGAVMLLGGSSGTTIEDLALTGESNAITNAAPVPGGSQENPDDITIRNNKLLAGTGRRGRGIQQFAFAGPPFNDSDPCNPAGPLVGISTGWKIEGNEIKSLTSDGIFISGNGTLVRRNSIESPTAGVFAQNNAETGGGAAPGNVDNTYIDNVIKADNTTLPFTLVTGGTDVAYSGFAPNANGCNIGHGALWKNNCIEVVDHSIGFAWGQRVASYGPLGSWQALDNDYSLYSTVVPPSGNSGLVNGGSSNIVFSKNRISGAGDHGLVSQLGTESGNLYEKNEIGLGQTATGHVAEDNGVAKTNTYRGNHYCSGSLFGPGVNDGGGNKDGFFCDLMPPAGPAKACAPRSVNVECVPKLQGFAPAPLAEAAAAAGGTPSMVPAELE